MPGGIAASIFGAMSEAGRASSLPGMAPPAPTAPFRWMCGRFLRDALRDLPVAVSVAALAAVALPGVGGLVILTLAGVRIGYRQAKAGFALRTAGIARFAGPGPLGVIRSGSLVVVRPRGLRVVRPGALSAGSLPKSPSRRKPGFDCRLAGGRPGDGHQCDDLGCGIWQQGGAFLRLGSTVTGSSRYRAPAFVQLNANI